jgi:hypothetical protein
MVEGLGPKFDALNEDMCMLRNDTNMLRSDTNMLRNDTNMLRNDTNMLRNDTNMLRNEVLQVKNDIVGLKKHVGALSRAQGVLMEVSGQHRIADLFGKSYAKGLVIRSLTDLLIPFKGVPDFTDLDLDRITAILRLISRRLEDEVCSLRFDVA